MPYIQSTIQSSSRISLDISFNIQDRSAVYLFYYYFGGWLAVLFCILCNSLESLVGYTAWPALASTTTTTTGTVVAHI